MVKGWDLGDGDELLLIDCLFCKWMGQDRGRAVDGCEILYWRIYTRKFSSMKETIYRKSCFICVGLCQYEWMCRDDGVRIFHIGCEPSQHASLDIFIFLQQYPDWTMLGYRTVHIEPYTHNGPNKSLAPNNGEIAWPGFKGPFPASEGHKMSRVSQEAIGEEMEVVRRKQDPIW